MTDPLLPAAARDESVEAVEEVVLRLVEESAKVTRQRVRTDRVRVSTRLETRRETLDVNLERETLSVERRPVDYPVDAPPPLRQDGDTTIFCVVEERAVVTRALFVVEEIHVRRAVAVDSVSVPVELRALRAVVERGPSSPASSPPSSTDPDPQP